PVCDGIGTEQKIDPDQVVPDPTMSLRDGAILPWSKTSAPYYQQTLSAVAKHFGASTGTAWNELPFEVQHAVLYGTGKTAINFVYDDGLRQYKTSKPFEGVIGNLERRYRETESAGMREEIERYMSAKPCVACGGYRLKPESLAVKLNGLHVGQVTEKSIRAAYQWFEELPKTFTENQKLIGERILKEIRERLMFLIDVGLDYLTMARNSGTLSGGESQRIRLA